MRKLLLTTTAIAFAVGAAAPAMAEFNSRNIRVSNGINQDHPVGNGIKAMQACLDDKSGGKLKLTAFWGDTGPALRRSGSGRHVVLAARRSHPVAWRLRPAIPLRQCQGSRCRHGRRLRRHDEQEAGRTGPRKPRLLGKRLPQPVELQACRQQVGRFLGPQGPRDAEQHLPRHLPEPRCKRYADGFRRSLLGA